MVKKAFYAFIHRSIPKMMNVSNILTQLCLV